MLTYFQDAVDPAPSAAIVGNVFANPREIGLVADDMFVVVALPHGRAGRIKIVAKKLIKDCVATRARRAYRAGR